MYHHSLVSLLCRICSPIKRMDTVSNIFCQLLVLEAVSTVADSATSINTPRRQIPSSVLCVFFKWFTFLLQAHDSPVRTMVWSHNDVWMVTGDHAGYVKYWQSNMNNVKMFQAHKEAIRGLRYRHCSLVQA